MKVNRALANLHAWLESMRGPEGYTGPVVHWWDSSLLYTGPQIDWRYEGIIIGYLELWRKTGQREWLECAMRAGDDAVRGQLPTGHFINSSFQHGAIEGGTPHEAAVDLALFELAWALKRAGNQRWQTYFQAGEKNLVRYYFHQLWTGEGFADGPSNRVLVPNKNATAMEALMSYARLAGKDRDTMISACTDVILRNRVHRGPPAGATIHTGVRGNIAAIGIYTARCLAALTRKYQERPESRVLDAIDGMAGFLVSLVREQGSVFGYHAGRLSPNPLWIAPSGDVLRALLMARTCGIPIRRNAILMLQEALQTAQLESGGIPTSIGLFEAGRQTCLDILPVAGWNDKAFRALAILLPHGAVIPQARIMRAKRHCTWEGRIAEYHESETAMRIVQEGQEIYAWNKGEPAPEIYAL